MGAVTVVITSTACATAATAGWNGAASAAVQSERRRTGRLLRAAPSPLEEIVTPVALTVRAVQELHPRRLATRQQSIRRIGQLRHDAFAVVRADRVEQLDSAADDVAKRVRRRVWGPADAGPRPEEKRSYCTKAAVVPACRPALKNAMQSP